MSYKTISADVDVDLDEWNDEELIEEMKYRGYTCLKNNIEGFDREDWDLLLRMIDSQPENWETRRVRDKLASMRYGV
jgi:hypothetical protein